MSGPGPSRVGRRARLLALGAAGALLCMLSACISLSGLGGGSKYACKAPDGVACESVSGTYANGAGTGQATPRPRSSPSPGSAPPAKPIAPTPAAASSASGTLPLRSQPRVLRLWTKAWEDADGDLIDQGYLYVHVESGRWLIEHVEKASLPSASPVRPPTPAPAVPPSASPDAVPAVERPVPSEVRPGQPRPGGQP